ncbi:MAG TPA: HlyD family secretion protein, partial [Stellaceae bacterium]|nr:HlyD family secretion protein [Stellaceae bacterium]
MAETIVGRADRAAPAAGLSRLAVRRLVQAGLLVVLVIAGAWYGRYWWTMGRFLESTDDAYVGGEVTVIAPKVAGMITDVAVTDNQRVHAGDLLVRIDDRDYRAALDRADAAVAAQQATLANLDATRRLREAMVSQAQADIDAADAEIADARDDQSRYRSLTAEKIASLQTFQKADAAYKVAFAAGQKARAELDAAERQLDVIDTQKQETRAALAEAIADRDLARINLGYTELRAPIDGAVGNRSARAGAYATVGAQLLSLVPTRGLWVDANFKEGQLAHLRPGMPASIEADVLPGQIFHGHVLSLAPATGAQFSVLPPENATGNFTKIVQRVPVKILIDNPPQDRLDQLRPGLSVEAA